MSRPYVSSLSPLFTPLVAPTKNARPKPMVPSTSLNQEQKRQLWGHLQTNHPEQVAFFDEPIVKKLMAQGATPLFAVEICESAGITIPRLDVD